ncbi:MAG: ABC transporter permease [Candidatus Thermoplasmatota archaeon]
MVLVLVIVVFILSAAFSTMAEQELESSVRQQVRAEMREWEGMNETAIRSRQENRTEELRREYNLHLPRWQRVFFSARDVLTFDFGEANDMTAGDGSSDVAAIIMDYLPNTILLFTTAAFIYTALGIAVGLKAAQRAGSKLDKFLSLFGMTASSMPMWWVGMIALLIFVYTLGWLPRPTPSFPSIAEYGFLGYLERVLIKMALPLAVIVFVLFGGRAWVTRNIVTGILQDDYIMAARAKGVPERKVIYGHTLKTAAPPVVTSAIMSLLLSVAGAMISEIIFQWPGMGYLLRLAIFIYTDVPVIIGISFVTAFLYIFGYYLADLIYGFLDPRVEVGAGSQMR